MLRKKYEKIIFLRPPGWDFFWNPVRRKQIFSLALLLNLWDIFFYKTCLLLLLLPPAPILKVHPYYAFGKFHRDFWNNEIYFVVNLSTKRLVQLLQCPHQISFFRILQKNLFVGSYIRKRPCKINRQLLPKLGKK